jgi:hypothetical protein
MHTIYHLESALEVNSDILDAIKAAYKNKPITITIEEDTNQYELTDEMKLILDQRLEEDESTYITAAESLKRLDKKNEL